MKKLLIIILMLLTMISIGYSTYQIQYSSYTGDNINLTGGSSYRGLTINSNGSSFYYSETVSDRVYQYDCTTAYNISSCTNSGKNLSIGGLEINPFGIVFNSNGSSFYFTGSGADTIFQYSCTTAYDISSCTNSGKNLSVSAQDGGPTSLTFNNIGTSVFMLGTINDRLFQYSCTTAYDISTCTYTSSNLNVLPQDNSPFGVTFNNGGLSVLVLGNQNDNLNQYDCTTAYNLSTCSYNSSFYVGTQDLTAYGLTINSNGSSFYIVGDTNDKIFQYSIPLVANPDITSIIMNDTQLKIGETSLLTIVFNEAVYNFTNTDITTIDNGVLSSVTSSDNITWTSTFTPTNDIKDLTNVITITKTNINNIYNLNGIGTNSTANYEIDTQRPTITSIIMNDTQLKIGETSLLTIVFNEAVYNFTNTDITTIDNGVLSSVTSSDNITWTSTFTPTNDIKDLTNVITITKTNINDYFGNSGNGTNSTANYRIDTLRPTITSMVMNDTALKSGDTSLLTIVFSEEVFSFTNADITTIDNGALSSVTSSDNITWTATFTPTTNITDTTNVITITKGNLEDSFGNAGSGTNSTANYEIDTANPTISNNILSEYNYYNISGFNSSCSDINLVSCNISINGQNKLLNATTFNFTTNGNQSYNITATDLAGNTATASGVTLVNPFGYVYFTNSTGGSISNFSINGTTYSNYFEFNIYDYGLGNHTFNFSKSSFIDTSFTLNLNTTSSINQTIIVGGATIDIRIYEVSTNTYVSPNNYSIFYYNVNDSLSQIYTITNSNNVSFTNTYSVGKTIQINLLNSTTTLLSTRTIVSPRENITIILYVIQNGTQYSKTFEVLTANLIEIANTDVDLYVNIPSTNEFVLMTTKTTDILGQVVFDVIPSTYVYNICNTYNGAQKCINQQVFDTTTTSYQIIHDSTLNLTIPVTILGNIEWSYEEETGTNWSYMTFTFEDTSAQTNEFCLNVTRYVNRTATTNYLECNTNYVGQVAQNYTLSENQYLKYTFVYSEDGITYIPLKSVNSYYEGEYITYFKNLGIYNYLFLIIIFVIIGSLLEFKSKLVYSIGFLGSTLIIYSIQSYLNYDFIIISMWGIFLVNHLLYWYTNLEL